MMDLEVRIRRLLENPISYPGSKRIQRRVPDFEENFCGFRGNAPSNEQSNSTENQGREEEHVRAETPLSETSEIRR